MVARSILAAALLAAVVRAQTIETSSASSVAASSTVSQSMPPAATQAFNPGNVSSTDAFNWCHAQLNTCPQICGGAASQNQCDSMAFTYTCVCPNGTVPDVTAYTETLPFYICQATYGQCINAAPDNAQAQQTCTSNQKCGTRNATAEAIAATSASAMSTSSATGSGTASASESGSATGSSTGSSSGSSATASGGAAVTNVQHIATGAFAALFLAAFRLLL